MSRAARSVCSVSKMKFAGWVRSVGEEWLAAKRHKRREEGGWDESFFFVIFASEGGLDVLWFEFGEKQREQSG